MKLELIEGRYERYYVAWCDEEGEGALVGQSATKDSVSDLRSQLETSRKKRDEDGWNEFEYLSVEIAARLWVTARKRDGVTAGFAGYEFESKAVAKEFLAMMRAAAKAARVAYDTGVEWPDWAVKAQAAGWKAPKGWKP